MEWDHYVDYLVRMQTASTWDGSEFIKAISYFERMTGIDSGLNKGYFGIVRDNDTLRNALQQWSTWRRSHSCASPPLRVELRSVGDDGLSVRFRDALEAAVRDDHRFTLALADESSADIVAFIPTNLTWKQIGARVKASYSLQLDSPSGAKLGISTGSCWEDDLRSCVGRAMRDLRRATRQMK